MFGGQLTRQVEGLLRYRYLIKKLGSTRREVNNRFHVSPTFQYIYVETPKVAYSTIKAILQSVEGRDLTTLKPAEIHFRAKSPLLAPNNDPALFLDILNSENTCRFTFVRNPYSRLLSGYLDKIGRAVRHGVVSDTTTGSQSTSPPQASASSPHMAVPGRAKRLRKLSLPPDEDVSFEQFVTALKNVKSKTMDPHWRPQHLLTAPQHIPYDFIGRFENLNDDISNMMDKLKIDAVHRVSLIPHRTDASNLIAAYCTESIKESVDQIYDQDFEIFGYEKSLDSLVSVRDVVRSAH